MITYELAKKLKDAGFPQDGKGQWCVRVDYLTKVEDIYVPTLSELIKACGDRLSSLENTMRGWRVMTSMRVNQVNEFLEIGYSTPEEAVANLWLALNKK